MVHISHFGRGARQFVSFFEDEAIIIELRGYQASVTRRLRAHSAPIVELVLKAPSPETFRGCRGVRRNEANWRRKWLSCHEGRRFGKHCVRGLLGGPGSGKLGKSGGGLEVLEGFESTEVHAIGGIDAPLNPSKRIEGILVAVAEWGIVLGGVDKFGAGEICQGIRRDSSRAGLRCGGGGAESTR